jgi:hypothetical protein
MRNKNTLLRTFSVALVLNAVAGLGSLQAHTAADCEKQYQVRMSQLMKELSTLTQQLKNQGDKHAAQDAFKKMQLQFDAAYKQFQNCMHILSPIQP